MYIYTMDTNVYIYIYIYIYYRNVYSHREVIIKYLQHICILYIYIYIILYSLLCINDGHSAICYDAVVRDF